MSDTMTGTPPRLRHRIAEEVRVLLARKNMSATRLAQRLGWTQQYLSRRMTGEQAFDADDLEDIAAAFGVSEADLLGNAKRSPSTICYSAAPAGPVRRPAAPTRPVSPSGPSRPAARGDSRGPDRRPALTGR